MVLAGVVSTNWMCGTLLCIVDQRGLEVCSVSARPSVFVDIYYGMYCGYLWYCTAGE